MERSFLILPTLVLGLLIPAARATIVYSGVQNIPIPLSSGGVYLNVQSGTTAASEPATWATEPWINPFFGGVAIGNSVSLLPVITGADQIVNLALGTPINNGSGFVSGESGSSTHTGPALNQFQIGVTGYIGYKFQWPGGGGQDYYGWMGINVNNAGAGAIVNWAVQNTPNASIQAGVTGVPEPGTVIFGMACAAVGLFRRKRSGRGL